jgi:hypothetical protein
LLSGFIYNKNIVEIKRAGVGENGEGDIAIRSFETNSLSPELWNRRKHIGSLDHQFRS